MESNVKLDECYSLIECCYFQNVLNDIPQSKKTCLSVIKLLNHLSKLSSDGDSIRFLSKLCLELYEVISKNGNASFLSPNDKICWISSKIDSNIYYPIIDHKFHTRELYAAKYDDLELPSHFSVSYKPIDLVNWGTDHLDSLYQDLLTNCSFVSAMLSIIEINQFQRLLELVSPHKPNENYLVTFNFNGCKRLVRIDNKFPIVIDNPHRNLFIKSFDKNDLLWPALIEKAFLKVMGNGYNFKGSNMSIDTYMLIGWLPEIIRMKNGILPNNFDQLWRFHQSGLITLGVGTSGLNDDCISRLKLISYHDYVIYLYDEDSITLKNPWISNENKIDRMIKLQKFDLRFISYLYINWNPEKLFKFHSNYNFVSKKIDQDTVHWYKKPQFYLYNPTADEEEIWLMLESHIQHVNSTTHINLSIFKTEHGEKVMLPNQYLLLKNCGINNTRIILLKFKLKPKEFYTIVVSGPPLNPFTLSLFNNISEEFKLAKSPFKYNQVLPLINDEWNFLNDGGNWSLSTFLSNPQYELEIKQDTTNMLILLFSESSQRDINFHLFYSDDKNVPLRNFDKSKLIFNESYISTSHFHDIKNMKPGSYKLILSSYNIGPESPYTLSILHDTSLDNVKITKFSNRLGLFLNSTKFDWDHNNRMKIYFKTDGSNCNFSIHLKHSNNTSSIESISDYRPAMRGSVFNAQTEEPIQINEQWNDSVYGVHIDCKTDFPGVYILLVERFEAGLGTCIVDVGCDKQFSLG